MPGTERMSAAQFLSMNALPRHADSSAKRLALGRLKTGEMNRTEARYDAHLAARQIAGEVLWRKFEGIKLRLADNTFYTPDFAVMAADGQLECHEVKGFWEEDARAKVKIAAALYPLRFVAVTERSSREGGGYFVEEF